MMSSPSPRVGPGALLHLAGPPLLLMAFIFWLGTDRGSASQTQSLIERLLSPWPGLLERLGTETLTLVNVGVRKLGHFTGYGLLGLLNARCLRGLCGTLSTSSRFTAWGAATGWAAVDEWRQSFSASRGGSPYDVILDSAGAAAGILLYLLCLRHRPPKS
jgi:VanZ family protein